MGVSPAHQYFSPSLSPSLPFLLKISKHNIKKKSGLTIGKDVEDLNTVSRFDMYGTLHTAIKHTFFSGTRGTFIFQDKANPGP